MARIHVKMRSGVAVVGITLSLMGCAATPQATTPPRSLTPPKKQMNSTDFFSSFGT